MSTRDNFAQAMRELLNSDSAESMEREEKRVAPSSFSSFSKPEPKRIGVPKELPQDNVPGIEEAAMEAIEEAPVIPPPQPVASAVAAASAPEYRPSVPSPAYQPAAYQMPPRPLFTPDPTAADTTTVIAPGTTVVGDVSTSGGLSVGGSVKGNLKVASTIELNGKVIGDIEAADAIIVGSTVRGSVTVSNVLTMDSGTTIVGDVAARSVEVNGKIKGNLTVGERSHFQSEAVLVGNLMSGTVIIDEGAMLKGDISITSAQTEEVSVVEPDFEI